MNIPPLKRKVTWPIFYKKTKFVISLWGLELVYKNKKGVLPFIHKLIVPIKVISKQKNFTFLTSSNSSTNLALNYGINKEKLFKIPLGVSKETIHQIKNDVKFKKYFLFSGRVTERKGLSWFAENVLPYFPEYKSAETYNFKERILKKTVNNAYKIIVNSQKALEDMKIYYNCDENKISIMPFRTPLPEVYENKSKEYFDKI